MSRLNNKVAIRSIYQKDNFAFTIEWTDGIISDYSLSELQMKCPCAGCKDTTSQLNPDTRATKIRSVGRYAIRIDFTSGCSHGIFDFDLLRTINKAEI